MYLHFDMSRLFHDIESQLSRLLTLLFHLGCERELKASRCCLCNTNCTDETDAKTVELFSIDSTGQFVCSSQSCGELAEGYMMDGLERS